MYVLLICICRFVTDYDVSTEGIQRMAESIDIPAGLLARVLVKSYAANICAIGASKLAKQLLKDFTLIEDLQLRYAITQVYALDPTYSPEADEKKAELGSNMEDILFDCLARMDLPFWNEAVLRELSYAKTPDVCLLYPISVNGTMVFWIESKAMFCDPGMHTKCYRKQYQPYINRYIISRYIFFM